MPCPYLLILIQEKDVHTYCPMATTFGERSRICLSRPIRTVKLYKNCHYGTTNNFHRITCCNKPESYSCAAILFCESVHSALIEDRPIPLEAYPIRLTARRSNKISSFSDSTFYLVASYSSGNFRTERIERRSQAYSAEELALLSVHGRNRTLRTRSCCFLNW